MLCFLPLSSPSYFLFPLSFFHLPPTHLVSFYHFSRTPTAMRLLLGKKSNRSLRQAAPSSPPPPTPPLTYPLPILPPLVHVQTESCPTTSGKPTTSSGASSATTPLRIHAMFSRSFSMNDVSLTDRPGQPISPPAASLMPRPARKEFLNREQEALLMQSRRRRGPEKDIQSKTGNLGYHTIERRADTIHPRRRKTYLEGRQDEQGNTPDLLSALPSRYNSSQSLASDINASYPEDSSNRLGVNFDIENPHLIRRSVSDPTRPASPPYVDSSLPSLPLGAAPAWKAARDAIATRGQPDGRQRASAMAPPLGKPISSNWVVLETRSPTLSHSTSLCFHPQPISQTSSPTSSLRGSDEGSSVSLNNSVRKKLSALNIHKISDESRPNTAISYTRKMSTNHIRRNFLSSRQKDSSISPNRDSGDSLDQEYFSSSSSASSLEVGVEVLADPFERRMISDSPTKTPSIYFQNF